ncbi:MAG: hypothetical protein VW835_17490 [Rickettsiales bacterium]
MSGVSTVRGFAGYSVDRIGEYRIRPQLQETACEIGIPLQALSEKRAIPRNGFQQFSPWRGLRNGLAIRGVGGICGPALNRTLGVVGMRGTREILYTERKQHEWP